MGEKLLASKLIVTLGLLCNFGSVSKSGIFVNHTNFGVSLNSEMTMWAKFLELDN